MKRSPLKRGDRVLVRRTPLQTKPRKQPQRSAPAVPPDVRDTVWARAGDACEVCGRGLVRARSLYSIHHRRPRRMGGSSLPDTNQAGNLILLCGSGTSRDGCHHAIESERAGAYRMGLLLTSGSDPTTAPVYLPHHGGWVLLDNEGSFTPIPTEES